MAAPAARCASRSGRRPCRHSAASFLNWRAPFGSSTSETEACHLHEGGGCVFAELGVLPARSREMPLARPLASSASPLASSPPRRSPFQAAEAGGGGGGGREEGGSPEVSTFLQTEGFTPFLVFDYGPKNK